MGRFDDLGVIRRKSLRELILLAFLEEEQVQGLLHLLLPFHGKQVIGLPGVLGDAAHGLALGRLQRAQLGLQDRQLAGQGIHDGRPHRRELVVQVHHHRVLGRCICQVPVPLENQGIIIGHLLQDGAIVDGRVQRNLLVVSLQGRQILIDRPRLPDPSLELRRLPGVLARLGHSHCACLAHVGDQVLGLVRGDVLVHVPQLLLDDGEPVADEIVRAHDLLVPLLHPLLVVHGHERVQDIIGPRQGHVAVADVDNGGVLVPEAGGNLPSDLVAHRVEAGSGDLDLASLSVPIVGRRHRDDAPERRFQRVTELRLQGRFGQGMSAAVPAVERQRPVLL